MPHLRTALEDSDRPITGDDDILRVRGLLSFLSSFRRVPVAIRWACVLAMVAGIGLFDRVTGLRVSLSLFYVAPVLLVAWTTGPAGAWGVAVLCGVATFLADAWAVRDLPDSLIPLWNAVMRVLLLGILASMTGALRRAFLREWEAARLDPLTGLANGRSFYEYAGRELAGSRRSGRPITVAYVDLDEFKHVNDCLGHQTGDQLLRLSAQALTRHLRPGDLVARLGGDEFAILLPGAGESEARTILDRILLNLRTEIREREWPASASIGGVVFLAPPLAVEDMVARADALMYVVKQTAKGRVAIEVEGHRRTPLPSAPCGVEGPTESTGASPPGR